MKDSLQRNDETKLQVAAREALVNSVIHADFKEESCSILVIKKTITFLILIQGY